MKYFFFYLGGLTFILSCNDTGSKEIKNNSTINVSEDSIKFKKFINHLYSQNSEDSLINYGGDCFRMFLWRFPKPNVTIIRIEKDSLNSIKLIAKEIASPSFNYDPRNDTLVNSIEVKIKPSEWDSLIELANQSYLWSMYENEYPPVSGSHGSLWYIEATRKPTVESNPFMPFNTYTSVKRHTPHKGSFYNLGKKMILLTGLINEEDIY